MTKIKQTRFKAPLIGGQTPVTTKRAAVGFDSAELPPVAADTEVFAREISAKDLREKIEQVQKAVYDVPDFSMAFTKQLKKDPVLRRAFVRFMQAVEGEHSTVESQPADKRASAKVMYSSLEVETFLKTFVESLKAMEESKAQSPVDISAIGLTIMDRTSQVMQYADAPIQMAPVLSEVASVGGLKGADREKFLTQLADAALHHVDKQDNRTPAGRGEALKHLRSAIKQLVANESPMTVINPYLKRAKDISKEQDGATGKAEQIQTMGLLLFSSKGQVKTGAERGLLESYQELLDHRLEQQSNNQHLSSEALGGFSALLEASRYSPQLFAKMPEFIEAVSNHPKLAEEAKKAEEAAAKEAADAPEADAAEAPAADAEAPEAADPSAPQVYAPSEEELEMQQTMLLKFCANLGSMFPDLSDADDKAKHLELTQKASGLIVEGLNYDQSTNLVHQVRQLTRHPESAMDALDLMAVMDNPKHKLNAGKEAVISAIQNKNLDAAYDLYNHDVFTEDDGNNLSRQADMLAATAEVVLQTRGNLEGSRPAQTWASRAHNVGVEQALKGKTRNNAALHKILNLMAADWDDWRLPAQESIEFVASVEAQLGGDENYHDFAPVLVGILAKHEDSEPCMEAAKDILDKLRVTIEQVGRAETFASTVNGAAVQTRPQDVFVKLLGVLSNNKTLSSFVRPLTEAAFEHLNIPLLAPQFAKEIPNLGDFADKTMLARQIDPHLASLTPDAVASIALLLAGTTETHQQARELIARFAEGFDGQDVQELEQNTRNSYMRAEAAVRLAVPNILTGDALTGLFAGYQAGRVSKEVIELVPMHLPDALIEQIIGTIDNADELRQIFADKKAADAAAAEEPAAEEPAAE